MKLKTFLIKYTAYNKGDYILKQGTVKAKRKYTAIEAQCEFEKFLRRKHPDMDRLVVHSCSEYVVNNIFSDIFKNNFGI